MAIISQRFHDIKTKFHAVTTYRTGRYSVYHICTKYHISKASLMRWNKAFDGTIDSLKEKSDKPKPTGKIMWLSSFASYTILGLICIVI